MALSDASLVTLVQAKNYLRIDVAASLHVDAEFVGAGDAGGTDEFDLDHTPVEGSLKLYLENVLQVEPTHFSIAVATITFVTPPPDGDIITASYDYAAEANTFESYDDLELESLIAAATRKAEEHTGRVFIQREIIETHIGDGTKMLKLYKMPIVSTVAIAITVDGVELESWSERLSIGRIYNLSVWEADSEIVVTYTAGYGDRTATQGLIPDAVSAVLLILADLYENRGDKVDSINVSGVGATSYKLPSRAEELLRPLRTSVL